jgi:hypothetical protein
MVFVRDMNNPTAFNRRTFLTSTLALATTLELQRAAFALSLLQNSGVCKLTPEQEVDPHDLRHRGKFRRRSPTGLREPWRHGRFVKRKTKS